MTMRISNKWSHIRLLINYLHNATTSKCITHSSITSQTQQPGLTVLSSQCCWIISCANGPQMAPFDWQCTITQSSIWVTDDKLFTSRAELPSSVVWWRRVQEAGVVLVVQWTGHIKSHMVLSLNCPLYCRLLFLNTIKGATSLIIFCSFCIFIQFGCNKSVHLLLEMCWGPLYICCCFTASADLSFGMSVSVKLHLAEWAYGVYSPL